MHSSRWYGPSRLSKSSSRSAALIHNLRLNLNQLEELLERLKYFNTELNRERKRARTRETT